MKLRLRRNPNSWFAHNNLGIAFAKENQSAEAKAHYDAALRLNPDCALAHYNLGNLFRRDNQFPEAIEEYQIALKLQPDYYHAHNNLGNALLAAGHPKDAVDEFAEALEATAPFGDARFNLGLALFSVGSNCRMQSPNSISHCNCGPISPRRTTIGLRLGRCRPLPEAIRHLKEAIRLQPDLAPAHRSLGFALAKSGNPEEAISAIPGSDQTRSR